MSGQRVEIQHHTLEQVGQYVRAARDILDVELGVGEWDGATFAAVVGLVSSKTVQLVAPQPIDLGSIVPGGNGLRGLR